MPSKSLLPDVGGLSPVQRSKRLLKLAFKTTFRAPELKHSAHYQIFPGSALIGAAILLVSFFFIIAMLVLDGPIIDAVHAFSTENPLVRKIFKFVTYFGSSAWILIISGALGLTLSVLDWRKIGRARRKALLTLYENANFVFFTVALSGIAASLIKNLIGRARPKLLDQLGPFHFDFATFESSFASFPSGHSTTFGCLCMAMVLLWPRYWPIWLVAAIIGGMSRTMILAHYPTDVIAGLLFGAGFALFSARFLALRNVMFAFDGDKLIPQRTK